MSRMRVTRQQWITSSLALLVICAGFYLVNRFVIVHGGGPLQHLYGADIATTCHPRRHDYYASTWATVPSGKSVHIQNVSIGGAKGAALTASYVLPASVTDQRTSLEISFDGEVPEILSRAQSAALWARRIEASGARLSGPDHHNG